MKKHIYFYCHTSGVSENDCVLELAIVDQYKNTLFNRAFYPDCHINEEATEVHELDSVKLKQCQPFNESIDEILSIFASAETVTAFNRFFADMLFNHIKRNRADVSRIKVNYFVNLYDRYSKWLDEYRITGAMFQLGNLYNQDISHINLDDVSAINRAMMLVDCHNIYFKMVEAELEKSQRARAMYQKSKAKKMALVPDNYADYPYYGMTRPEGYKTMSQLKVKELETFEYAGQCCSTYGDQGHLFKPVNKGAYNEIQRD